MGDRIWDMGYGIWEMGDGRWEMERDERGGKVQREKGERGEIEGERERKGVCGNSGHEH